MVLLPATGAPQTIILGTEEREEREEGERGRKEGGRGREGEGEKERERGREGGREEERDLAHDNTQPCVDSYTNAGRYGIHADWMPAKLQ